MDGVQAQLLGALGQIHLALGGAELGGHTGLQVGLGGVAQHLAQQLGKLGGVLGLLIGGLLPVQADLRIALPVGHTGHGQIHAHLRALALEILPQAGNDILGGVLGHAQHMLGGIDGVIAGVGLHGRAADGALLNGLFADITTDGTYVLHKIVSSCSIQMMKNKRCEVVN